MFIDVRAGSFGLTVSTLWFVNVLAFVNIYLISISCDNSVANTLT